MREYFFAYGTLQPGGDIGFFEDNNLGKYLKFIDSASMRGALMHIKNLEEGFEYPGLIQAGEKSKVQGTLFEVIDSKKVYELMDPWEDFQSGLSPRESRSENFYERKVENVYAENLKMTVEASVYTLNQESDHYKNDITQKIAVVESGNWLEYRERI